MERLTIRNEKGIALWVDAKCASGKYRMTDDVQDQKRLNRLATYEDTRLEPCEIETMKTAMIGKAVAEIKEFNGISIDHLRKLVQAEQDGRLVVLPCKIGDTIWWVEDVVNWHNGKKHVIKRRVCSEPYSYDMLYWIETPIYMTREEAEAVLAEKARNDRERQKQEVVCKP